MFVQVFKFLRFPEYDIYKQILEQNEITVMLKSSKNMLPSSIIGEPAMYDIYVQQDDKEKALIIISDFLKEDIQMSQLKRTPLYEQHEKLGAKLVEFGGWEMPVWYTSIIEEHKTVRETVGLFDVSHMGEIEVKGKDAQKFVEYIITNNVTKLPYGGIVYSPMCNEKGGVVDDLLAYKINEEYYLLVVNASNIDKDYSWIMSNTESFSVQVKNLSQEYGQIAVQGPKAEEVLQKITTGDLKNIAFYNFIQTEVMGFKAIVSRTGYTGEDGFEVYLDADNTVALWEKLLELVKPYNGIPCGLGARDTLRFEAVYMLYGNELNDVGTPLEAGLKWAVDLEKDFIGSDILKKQEETGLTKKLRGIEILDKVPARHGYIVMADGKEIGVITSASKSISTGKNLALGYIDAQYCKFGTDVQIQIRDKSVPAKIIKTPFYRGSVKNSKTK